jgi:glycosyltransferase involved in cell wall biosynthesis
MKTFVQNRALSNRVTEALNISSSELMELYCNASALLFPSLEEGFGWPLLEAQACGCLVVTTGRPPMTEIAGDAAIYIDPSEPQKAAHRLSIVIHNDTDFREAGFKNLDRFNETKVTAQYMECYDELVAQCDSLDGIRKPTTLRKSCPPKPSQD